MEVNEGYIKKLKEIGYVVGLSRNIWCSFLDENRDIACLLKNLETLQKWVDKYFSAERYPGLPRRIAVFTVEQKIQTLIQQLTNAFKMATKLPHNEVTPPVNGLARFFKQIDNDIQRLAIAGFTPINQAYPLKRQPCSQANMRECSLHSVCSRLCGKTLAELPYPIQLKTVDFKNVEENCPFCNGPGEGWAVTLQINSKHTFATKLLICRSCHKIYGEYE